MDIRISAGTTAYRPIAVAGDAPVPATSVAMAAVPTQSASALKQADPPPSTEQLAEALKSINSALQERAQNLEFSVDSDSARTIVTVTDKTTHEVIRQMPTKEAMEIAKALDRLQSVMFKQTA